MRRARRSCVHFLVSNNSRVASRGIYKSTTLRKDNADMRSKSNDERHKDVRIVVIGGGIAGLSAANHLQKYGFHRTLVLEATERFGGRIISRPFGDTFCELGAKWICIDGALYQLLSGMNSLQKRLHKTEKYAYIDMPTGRTANPKTVELISTIFHELCTAQNVAQLFKTSADLQHLDNVMAYFNKESSKLIETLCRAEDRATAHSIFDSLIKEFGGALGCNLEYANIEHVTRLPKAQQLRPVYIPTGLDNILHSVTDNLSMSNVQMGKPVGQIQWQPTTSASRATTAALMTAMEAIGVGCLDGSIFLADHIICTLPLGVLKNFSNILFNPALPQHKLAAINNLGYGSPVKIYLEYQQPIAKWFKINLRPINVEPTMAPVTERRWTQQVVEIMRVPSSNRVLEVLIGGGYYSDIEKLPDVEILERITALLRRCLQHDEIPYPHALLRSNWSTSPCFFGGRPYFAVQSTAQDVQNLAQPLPAATQQAAAAAPALLFAGDATILNGFGTIDGARASGIREAQRIIDYYQRLTKA